MALAKWKKIWKRLQFSHHLLQITGTFYQFPCIESEVFTHKVPQLFAILNKTPTEVKQGKNGYNSGFFLGLFQLACGTLELAYGS